MYSDRVSTSRLRRDLGKGGCTCPLKIDLGLNEHHAFASSCYKEGQGIVTRPYLGAKVCLAFDSTCSRSKWAQKTQAVVEKTEDFFPVLTEKGRGNPGAHALARMWGMSTEMDVTFVGGQDACP